VDGATFVKKLHSYGSDWDYLFVTPSEGQIFINAGTATNEDFGSGELYLFSGHSNFADPPVELDSDRAGAGLPLSVSGSIAIDHALQNTDISASFSNNSAVYIHLYLFARPTITSFSVNATTFTRAARVYGQVIPKDYATDICINYTHEDQTARFVKAESGISTGSFADTFVALDYPAGNWMATAQVNASYGTKLSLVGIFSEFPKDILVYSKSVSYTSHPSTGEQQAKLIWNITRILGEVMVLKSDTPEWIPAVLGLPLGPGDSIATGHSVDDAVVLQTVRAFQLLLAKDSELMVQGPSIPTDKPGEYINPLVDEEFVLGVLTLGGESFYYSPESATGPNIQVKTPDAVVTDSGTRFEIVVDSGGTTVRTFNGSVRVGDLNGTHSVTVGEGQTTVVSRGGIPSNSTSFDPSEVDRWWEVVPEFPAFLFSPIFMMATLLAVIVYRRKPR